jgi:hypothetical protein
MNLLQYRYRFYHRTCKALRDKWQLFPLKTGVPAIVRYGKCLQPATGLLAIHDLYSKWGEHVHAKIKNNDCQLGLVFGSTFNCAICEHFGPMFWYQHEEALATMFEYYASDGKLLRDGFQELMTVLTEIQQCLLQWSECRAFRQTRYVPPTRNAKGNRLELLERTQCYQLDKLLLKLKTIV